MSEPDESGAAVNSGGPAGLAALAARWRETARVIDEGPFGDDEYNAGMSLGLRTCAGEVEALIAETAPDPAVGVTMTPAEFRAFTRKHGIRWEELRPQQASEGEDDR